MPFLEINGASIYYETFGRDRHASRHAPLVLIHGSTMTGQADWGAVTPLLARHYRVIVPDCRGHSRSSNPQHCRAPAGSPDPAADCRTNQVSLRNLVCFIIKL